MSIRRVVSNITSTRMEESREFYTTLFGFEVAMDMGWVITLSSPSNPTAQISLVRGDDSVSQGSASQGVGPTISIEVADVDAVHSKALTDGYSVVYPLTDEPWGVRRFHVTDPNGVILNVLSHGSESP
ncbi:MAG: VOC family protein [Deltaproteobacteria bacterium]|nr:VOC family protein [Deltaproteobacteria bacterium]